MGLCEDYNDIYHKPTAELLYQCLMPQLISFGICNDHVFIKTNDNKLIGFGNNEKNQLGIVDDIQYYDAQSPLLIQFKFNAPLKTIACGDGHTLFLTINGTVYGCGQFSLFITTVNF